MHPLCYFSTYEFTSFSIFDPTKKSMKKILQVSAAFFIESAFFGFGFWALLERRVDEIKNRYSEIIFDSYLTHHLPAISEFSIFSGDTNAHVCGWVLLGETFLYKYCLYYFNICSSIVPDIPYTIFYHLKKLV